MLLRVIGEFRKPRRRHQDASRRHDASLHAIDRCPIHGVRHPRVVRVNDQVFLMLSTRVFAKGNGRAGDAHDARIKVTANRRHQSTPLSPNYWVSEYMSTLSPSRAASSCV